jgi:hypothetical protein
VNELSNRPPGYTGKKELYLSRIAKDLAQEIDYAYASLSLKTLCLTGSNLARFSEILVEFAEDLHNDIGIWRAYEKYNIEFFGTPLPIVLPSPADMGPEPINRFRIQFLLWELYSEFFPDLCLAPTHRDLRKLSAAIAAFLENRFKTIPRGSSVKDFLSGPNQFGWEVKRKLVWLGTQSYLFRNSFWNYVSKNGGQPEIPVIDDFICQSVTAWSGLGVIDILAAQLDLPQDQRTVLRSWYERHLAYFQIMSSSIQHSEVKNLINDQIYAVQIARETTHFEVGAIVIGSLIPWNGEWVWSGQQSVLGRIPSETIQELKDQFIIKTSQVVYRYCSERAQKARESLTRQFQQFIEYHGKDLVVYPDGLAMAADYQKAIRRQWESQPREVIAEMMAKHQLKAPEANIHFPPDLIERKDGVGVFFNPDVGQEMMTGFNGILSGFSKQGINLNQAEQDGIRAFICSDLVSPAFVKRLIREYGSESIEAAFLIQAENSPTPINFLLRRYKGTFYRKRYPHVTLH